MSRQQLRRNRLLEQEKEQHLEDAEGLVVTEDQRKLLLSPFMSVKFEFHDLDGLRWTQTALRKYQPQCHRRPTILPSSTLNPACVLLAKAPSSAHDVEATIRGSLEYLPSGPRHSPKFSRNKYRSPLTSQSFWDPDADTGMLTLSFPLPPSTLPRSPLRKSTYTFLDGLGLTVPPDQHSGPGESILSFSINHSEDEIPFYNKVLSTQCISTATFRRPFS